MPLAPIPLRRRPPDTRSGETRKVEIGGFDLYVTVNFYDDDQPAEVYSKVGKEGSTIGGLVNSMSLLISMLLQAGVPAQRIIDRLSNMRFEPSSDRYSSIPDAIAKTMTASIGSRGGVPSLNHSNREVLW